MKLLSIKILLLCNFRYKYCFINLGIKNYLNYENIIFDR